MSGELPDDVSLASDCFRLARYLLERAEALLDGGWLLAAWDHLEMIGDCLSRLLVRQRGPQPGLVQWIAENDRSADALMLRAELRGAIERCDLVGAIVALSALTRRVSADQRASVS